MDTKDKIVGALPATGRENMDKVVDYMEKNGFFTRGCHRHHKYTGGLADHSWIAYQAALSIGGQYMPNVKGDDSVAICTLLHDFCDCRGMYYLQGHGKRSARMLQALGIHLSSDEYLAIRFHMDLDRHKNHPLYRNAVHCKLRQLVNEADNISANEGGRHHTKPAK